MVVGNGTIAQTRQSSRVPSTTLRDSQFCRIVLLLLFLCQSNTKTNAVQGFALRYSCSSDTVIEPCSHRVGRTNLVLKPILLSDTDQPDNDTKYRTKHNGNTKTSAWLRWTKVKLKSRGTSQVIMRQPEELGGIPHSARYSSKDWWHNAISLPNSGILHEIRGPVSAVTSWATFLSLWHRHLVRNGNIVAAQRMELPSAPLSLMMSALALLLVFRTNSAYQRFHEGRKIWEDIANTARDLSRMVVLYEADIGTEKRRRIQRLLVAFPYLLRHRIRPSKISMRRLDDEEHKRDPTNTILLYQDTSIHDDDPDAASVAHTEETTGGSRRKMRTLYWVDKRTLPWRLLPSTEALEKCARAQNRPLWVCDRIAAEVCRVPDSTTFTSRERLSILKHVELLSKCIGGAERIHQTTVPLNYARHTLRALTVWLFAVPLTFVKDLQLLTAPMCFIVAWLLFGVYEIGYSIEDPFQGSLRLSILSDGIRRDVLGDENVRLSAFTLEEDEINDQSDLNDEEQEQTDIANEDASSHRKTIDNIKDAYQ